MADRALVSIFFRQIAVGRTSCGFAGTILPRHIGQSGSRAGFHAFRFAVAKEALAGFLFFAVEAHHVPRTGFLAESAADALVFIHIAGAGLGVDADGTLRAGISTRDRVRTDGRCPDRQCCRPKRPAEDVHRGCPDRTKYCGRYEYEPEPGRSYRR